MIDLKDFPVWWEIGASILLWLTPLVVVGVVVVTARLGHEISDSLGAAFGGAVFWAFFATLWPAWLGLAAACSLVATIHHFATPAPVDPIKVAAEQEVDAIVGGADPP